MGSSVSVVEKKQTGKTEDRGSMTGSGKYFLFAGLYNCLLRRARAPFSKMVPASLHPRCIQLSTEETTFTLLTDTGFREHFTLLATHRVRKSKFHYRV